MKLSYPEVTIGSLSSPEPGAFKIGPFGSSLKKDELVAQGIPVVGIENVLPNNFVPGYRRFITPEKFEQLSQYEIKPFDLVVTTMGTVGRAAVIPEGIGTTIIDSHLFRMRLNLEKVEPAYLCYALNGYVPLKNRLKEKAVGAIMAGLNTKILKECTIPLPPLNEQQHVAAWLNEQMAAVTQARQAAEEQFRAARELPSAYLRDIFDGNEAKSWEKIYIDDFTDSCSGTTPSRARSDYYDGHIPWVKTGELKDGFIVDSEEHVTDLAIKETSLKLLPENTLLIAMYGQGQTRGRTCIIKKPMTINQACFAILPNDTFDTEFLQFWFRHNYDRLRKETEGRGGNQPNLNGQVLKKQLVQIPKFDEQQYIVKILRAKILQAEYVASLLEARLAEINQLPSALLRRAFSGEL